MADPPFACPPDIVLDIPVPPSVNRSRRVDWAAMKKVNAWKAKADLTLMANGQYRKAKPHAIKGQYELTIVLNEKTCRLDQDNPIKPAIDYLRKLGLITDDSKKYGRRLVVEWGEAPEGCRLILRRAA